jgi:hypothetical protein
MEEKISFCRFSGPKNCMHEEFFARAIKQQFSSVILKIQLKKKLIFGGFLYHQIPKNIDFFSQFLY